MHNRHIKVNDLIIGIISMILGIYCGGCTPSGDSTNTPKYKTFITAAKFNGDIQSAGGQATAIESADSLCMADANKPTDSSTYKAMLVDGTNRLACTTSLCSGGVSEHIDWVLQPNAAYYRSDGTTLILKTNADGVFDFGASDTLSLSNSFDTVASTYWTGLMGDWTSNPNDRCLGWTLPDYGPTLGAYGLGDQTNSSSIGGTDFCNAVRRLVCVQQ